MVRILLKQKSNSTLVKISTGIQKLPENKRYKIRKFFSTFGLGKLHFMNHIICQRLKDDVHSRVSTFFQYHYSTEDKKSDTLMVSSRLRNLQYDVLMEDEDCDETVADRVNYMTHSCVEALCYLIGMIRSPFDNITPYNEAIMLMMLYVHFGYYTVPNNDQEKYRQYLHEKAMLLGADIIEERKSARKEDNGQVHKEIDRNRITSFDIWCIEDGNNALVGGEAGNNATLHEQAPTLPDEIEVELEDGTVAQA